MSVRACLVECRSATLLKLDSTGVGQPALWNACPMKCGAYFIGAKPIPLGWPILFKTSVMPNNIAPAIMNTNHPG